MAVNTISINPALTSVAAGSFNVTSEGYVQGMALDQPAVRYALSGGVLALTETLPMWGGVLISEATAGASSYPLGSASLAPSGILGSVISRATSYSTTSAAGVATGFSVFDQDVAMLQTPENEVPLALSGMQVNFYRFGSGARIPVACSPNLVNWQGEIITTPVGWDYTNEQLEPFVPASTTVSSGTYTSGTGAVALTTSGAHGLSPGDTFALSGVTGTGSFARLDGTWTATAGTTGTTLNFTAATGLTLTITGGTVSNGTALPVRVLDVNIGNSMTVNWSGSAATWNRSGNTAIVLI
jgi:hypothetical protein